MLHLFVVTQGSLRNAKMFHMKGRDALVKRVVTNFPLFFYFSSNLSEICTQYVKLFQ